MGTMDNHTIQRLSIAKGGSIPGNLVNKGNLARILIDAADQASGDRGITFIQNDDSELFYSYKTILARAERSLGALQDYGLKPGDYALLILNDNAEFIVNFWACILGGIVPIPLPYPVLTNTRHASVTRFLSVWNVLNHPAILSDSTIWSMRDIIKTTLNVRRVDILNTSFFQRTVKNGQVNLSPSTSTAYIQFSSGSTSAPKGVLLSHENLLVNMQGIINHALWSADDIFLSWMPYSHDMGLIGFNLAPTVLGAKQFNMMPQTFVKKPELWFDMISKNHVTIACSPNFGYRHLLTHIRTDRLTEWDLSSLRLIFNGAEPISASLIYQFITRLASSGLSKTAMYPVYGLAEATLAVAFPPPGTQPLVHSVNRTILATEGIVEKTPETAMDSLLVVDEGYPLPETELRIIDQDGRVVTEGTVGEIQIRGKNVTAGYVNNPEATAASFQDGWFKTGDTGFMLEGRVAVTGRIKDIIFVNGQNCFAHDVEQVIEGVNGMENARFAVCGWTDEVSGTEKVGLFIKNPPSPKNLRSLYSSALARVNEFVGIPLDYIIKVPSIPKTTSGKIQRFALVDAFKRGDYAGHVIDASELRLQPAGKQDNDQQPTVRRSGVHWETIRDIWSTVLNMPAHTIPMDQPFLSLGGTSIKAVQVLGALETELGLSLTNDIIIKCHTVNQLDEYLTALTGRAGATRHDRTETPRASSAADIAVIETACRFPDAATPEEFWTNLVDGRCSIGNIPSDRWNVPTDNACCQAGAFIADPYAFDPGFFKIPEGEAAVMDPQQRLILQLFFELLERAGYTKKDVDGKRVAIFIGASGNTYYELRLHSLAGQALQELASFAALAAKDRQAILAEWEGRFGSPGNHPNMAVGNIMNMIAARVAHEFNLHGPNMVIDTACSSSLVAIHLACESLRKGECEMAVAGGVNLILTPSPYLLLSGAGVLSASGRAKVFDASADGFVPGEGAGLVLLKPLERAMADGDRVLAVVKGSAVNNDGHALGVMSPNPDGQKEVIEQVYTKTGIDPGTIQYVEAHATGTAIGDPIEIRALSNAFSRWTPARQSIAVGSVKTNIGHLIGSAGVASFIKMILSFTNGKLPPLINLNTPNPAIKFEQTPFYPLTKAKAWPVQPGAPRRAAIDSFGFGGTNCHMLLEEAPAGETLDATDKPLLPRHVLCLSAHSPAAFVRKAHDLADYLERRDDFQLGDACFSENLRTPLVYRTHAVASSPRELMFRLREAVPTKAKPSPKVGFMFTGQGSQYVGMGRALYDSLPSFKDILDACSGLFSPFLQTKITDLIYSEDADERTIGPASLAQAVTFALDYALGKYLIQIGIKPSFLIGHGTGEWVAASLAGAMELPVAVRLVAATGKLMGDLSSSNGGMAAVFADVNTIEQLLAQFGGSLRIAAYNLSHLVVSGTMEDITGFLGILRGKGIMGKKLSPAHGSHTPLVEPMLENFRREMDGIDFRLPQIPFVSTVGGGILNQPPDADHWSLHSTAPVRFEEGINYMRNKGVDVFLEVGPDKILGDMLNSLPDRERIRVFSTCSRHSDGLEVFLDTLGKLFTTGVNIDWRAFEKDFGHERALLPAYPFAHKRYTLFDRQEARQH